MRFLTIAGLLLAFYGASAQHFIKSFYSASATQALGNNIFITANVDDYGAELYVSNGQSGNLSLVKDINPGPNGSEPKNFTVFQNELYFTAYSPNQGYSVWKTNGTPEGTVAIHSNPEDAQPANLMVFKNNLYFTTYQGSIYRTDGTVAGTNKVYQSDYTYGHIQRITKTDDYIYFIPDGRTIYRYDGASIISFLGPLSFEDVYFKNLFVLGNTLVVVKSSTYDGVIRFYALPPGAAEDEWVVIKKLDAPLYGSQYLDKFTVIADKLYFSFRKDYDNVPETDELWVSDGTDVGTKAIAIFGWNPHLYSSEMSTFFAFNNKLYFRGGAEKNKALWSSDGTSAGTSQVHDVIITPHQNAVHPVLITENKFYFGGYLTSPALWVSDGTNSGTQLLLPPQNDNAVLPQSLTESNGVVYFTTAENYSATLWSSLPSAEIEVGRSYWTRIKSGETVLLNNVNVASCTSSEITVRNAGLKELHISSAHITGRNFYLEDQDIPENLAPGESVNLKILFTGVEPGLFEAVLTIKSNDLNEPEYTVKFSATAVNNIPPTGCQHSGSLVTKIDHNATTKPIILSNVNTQDGHPKGLVIGEFSLPSAGQADYSFVTGVGDEGNAFFVIDGNKLMTGVLLDADVKNTYSIRVKATESDSESEATFVINVSSSGNHYIEGNCDLKLDRLNFAYTSLEVNSAGHLFAATSEGTILRSSTDGVDWETVYSGHGGAITDLRFIENIGYADGNGVLLKTEDSGASWFQVYLPFTQDSYSHVHSHFRDKLNGHVAVNNTRLLVTDDGGHSWKSVAGQQYYQFFNLYFVNASLGFAINDWRDLVKTTDGGRSWSQVDLSTLGWNVRARNVWFIDELKGFLATDEGLFISKDGGLRWTAVSALYGSFISEIKFYNSNLGFAYGYYSSTIAYRTDDGGITWTMIIPANAMGTTTGVAVHANKIFVATASDTGGYGSGRSLSMTSDVGATWTQLAFLPEESIYGINFTSSGDGYVHGPQGVFRTQNRGLTWLPFSVDGQTFADIHLFNEKDAIFVRDGNIYKTEDAGVTVRNVLTTEQDPNVGGHYFPAGKLYAFDNVLFSVSWYAMYRSDDLGENWELVSANIGYYTQDLYFVSSEIGYRIELFGSVEKTSDGGKTWNEIFTHEPTDSDAFNAIFFQNENDGYAGGEYLRRTSDGGITWERINWPLSDIIDIHFVTREYGYVVSRNGTVHETNDSGLTWTNTYYGFGTQIWDAQFENGELYIAGEKGLIMRLSGMKKPTNAPGYIHGPSVVCTGDVVMYNVGSNGHYETEWASSATGLKENNSSFVVEFQDTGTQTITASHFNSCGIGESRSMNIEVMPLLDEDLIIEGKSQVFAGEQGVVYKVSDVDDSINYLWSVDGDNKTINRGDSLTIDWSDGTTGSINLLAIHSASGCRGDASMIVEIITPVATESDLSQAIHIYPNPTQRDVSISSSHHDKLQIRVRDVTGKEHASFILEGEENISIPTRHLAAGLYLLEISDGRTTATKKIIKN